MSRKGLPKSIIKKYGITKKAWRVFRGRKPKRSRSTRKTKRRKSNPRRRGKSGGGRMAKGKSLYRSVMKLAKVGALIAPGAAYALYPYTTSRQKIGQIVRAYTGYSMGPTAQLGTKTGMEWGRLVEGWGPFIGVSVAEKAIAFFNRLLRSI